MAAKEAHCSHCGAVYSLRRLRCPECHLEREDRSTPATLLDRAAGLVLLSLGGLIALGMGWFIYRSRFARHAIFLLLPFWLMLHGGLLLAGIHLRDFYAWWNRLSQPAHIAIQVLGLAALVGLVWLLLVVGR
jgi:hypothetical protein